MKTFENSYILSEKNYNKFCELGNLRTEEIDFAKENFLDRHATTVKKALQKLGKICVLSDFGWDFYSNNEILEN